MANVINKAINKFGKGLVMDFSPENTGNEVLTNALNATLLTFNGNELSLQNDMGNARVETAFLPEGYIPVGTCEYGGIIYIVSYNPLEDKSLIGCFPSPERNISSDEIGTLNQTITYKDFQEENENGNINGNIKHLSKYVLLKEDNLNPGDKFIILTGEDIYGEKLQDLYIDNKLVKNPILKISVVSIEDSGKITYLDSTLRQYEKTTHLGNCKYHILGSDKTDNNEMIKPDIDAYRNVLSSGYNVFKSKTSGKLALLAELITIDSYSVTHSIVPNPDFDNEFDIYIHTEVSPMPEQSIKDNLSKSSPSIPSPPSNPPELVIIKSNYYQTPKLKYYYLEESQGTLDISPNPINLFNKNNLKNNNFLNTTLGDIYEDLEDDLKKIKLESGNFDFPESNTYHGSNNSYLISNNSSDSNYLNYSDIKLGSIKIPKEIFDDNHTFPFKYNYTLVPCMEYGKLENLKITNTINFDNIKNFDKSDFNCWRYHIDGNQLKLTFGAEIYDSTSDEKVIGLFLEFYDHNGFVGSLSIDGDRKSYSGEFTRILSLDTPNVLSNNKIDNDKKSLVKCKDPRNVNIIKTENGHSYFGQSCKIINGMWTYIYQISNNSNQNPELKNRASGSTVDSPIPDDSCILQSNLIYGVRLYFKIRNNNEIIYDEKDPRILFTFPIYNNHYYNTKDFSELKPELKLALNYKLIDESNRDVYSNNNLNIENGYYTKSENNLSDYLLMQQYMKGNYDDNSNLHATKYYLYEGKTELKLEVGLKKEYESIGFWSEGLEDIFKCDLYLMGDSTSNTHYYESDIPNLNYKKDWSNINTLTFDGVDFYKKNTQLNNPFIINYKFVVGYKFDITNIRSTEVPVTTFCALCYKNNDKYNYEDFNIYESNDNYYSNFIVNSSGDSTNAFLNLYRQSSIEERIADKIKTIIDSNSTTNTDQNENNKIQTSLIKKYYNLLGKFTFCIPHSHIHDPSYGNSLTADNHYMSDGYNYDPKFYYIDNNQFSGKLYIARSNDPKEGGDYEGEETDGIGPTACYYYNPLFTMCPITQSLIIQESKFISVINSYNNIDKNDSKYIKYYNFTKGVRYTPRVNYLMEFSGISNKNLINFNKCLLETMKNVYVYNPDYNTLNIKVGDVNLQEYNVKFISNIISSNSELKDENIFNNYIYFYNNFKLSLYITDLCNKLDINKDDIKDQITFKPNYTYCGTTEPFYLITTLNYNIPSPKTLVDELSFKSSGIMIKHSNGNIEMFNFNKIPDKNLLYGIDKNNNLILLNAGNYTINDNGSLIVKDYDSKNLIIYTTPTNYYSWGEDYYSTNYKINDNCKKYCLKYSKITLSDLLYIPYNEHKLYLKDNYKYRNDPNTKVYYRKIYEDWKDGKNDWHQDTRNKNYTLMYFGPGFNEE